MILIANRDVSGDKGIVADLHRLSRGNNAAATNECAAADRALAFDINLNVRLHHAAFTNRQSCGVEQIDIDVATQRHALCRRKSGE